MVFFVAGTHLYLVNRICHAIRDLRLSKGIELQIISPKKLYVFMLLIISWTEITASTR